MPGRLGYKGKDRRVNPLKGIALKLVSVVIFVAMASLVKVVAKEIPAPEVAFFRSLFAIPVILVWLIYTGHLRDGIVTRNFGGHLGRGLMGTMAMGFGFAALGLLPLPEATAIGYAAPLLTVVFAAMFLGERLRLFRVASVVLGLAGVLVILSPRLMALRDSQVGATEAAGAAIALTGAVFAALAQVFARRLVHTEAVSAIVFWFSVNSALLFLVTLPWGWVMPQPSTFLVLAAIGILGGLGQVFLTSSYRHADVSVVAPFEYASMLLALAVGYLAFDEVPTRTVLWGAGLVVAAGILIILRERRLGLERQRQRQAVPPQS